jgi:hypothetical protein
MLDKINKLTSWQAAIIIAIIGFAVFFTGLNNPFQGDDINQIVTNVPVHSITHIRLFFEGGTFYNGGELTPLVGGYYRPLMTTAFSLVYTMFGAHQFYFHLLQLLLCIGSTIILYLFFRYSFRSVLALVLSLIFLLHPVNSQVVYAIPSMQEALLFFFGILALYLLLRLKSVRSLLLVAVCLFLSLLSKETGILFVAMALLYLFWWDRKRLYLFMGIMALPVALYLALRIHAVGLFTPLISGPIDSLSLASRLLTAPSIFLFYITKFIFPVKLAAVYYWTYPTFSVRHVLLPLVIDLAVIALVVYLVFVIRKKASKTQYFTYLFFAIWSALGMFMLLQIVPLDMTACEIWFYFPMAGVLGMIGVVLVTFQARIRPIWFFVIAALLIGLLGVRTAFRGADWRSAITLDQRNISASKEDYNAYNNLAKVLVTQGNYSEAKAYLERSISIYPTYNNYHDLGALLESQGDYSGAAQAFGHALKYSNGQQSGIYEDIATLTMVYGDPASNKQFLLSALKKFPQDSNLWLALAILEDKNNDNPAARVAITKAASYGQIPQSIHDNIMNARPFSLNFGGTGQVLEIP